jgi:hypothetical protein
VEASRQRQEARGETSIIRYEPILKPLGIDLKGANWTFLKAATDIRHCLLHANGRVSMMTRPPASRIAEIVAGNPAGLAVNLDRVVLKVDYLKAFVDEVRELQLRIAPAT